MANAVGALDDRGVTRRDVGPHLADLPVLDQNIRLGEVAERTVKREHNGVLDEDAARAHEAALVLIGPALSTCTARHPGAGGKESSA
jgi:hypothetical protein